MRQTLFCLCCMALFTSSPSPFIFAASAETETSEPNLCTKEELMSYFPPQLVKRVLIQHKIPQEEALKIASELAKRSNDLEKLVEEKAAKLTSNPFKDLGKRDIALKIYRETLLEIFNDTLKKYGMTAGPETQMMLDDIQVAKSKLFIDCIRKEQIIPKNSPPPPSP